MIYKNGKLLDEKPNLNDNFIYEVIRSEDGVYLFLEDHMKRLYGNLEKANNAKFRPFEKKLGTCDLRAYSRRKIGSGYEACRNSGRRNHKLRFNANLQGDGHRHCQTFSRGQKKRAASPY